MDDEEVWFDGPINFGMGTVHELSGRKRKTKPRPIGFVHFNDRPPKPRKPKPKRQKRRK